MRRPRPPLFLAKQSYRLRRVMDAARFLPFLGLALFLLPILWQPAASPEADTLDGWSYMFAVWLGLILGAAALSWPLRQARARDGDEAADDGPGGGGG